MRVHMPCVARLAKGWARRQERGWQLTRSVESRSVADKTESQRHEKRKPHEDESAGNRQQHWQSQVAAKWRSQAS